MDHLSTTQRSRLMASIKAKDTKPEKLVRSMLHAMGLRFRLHRKDLPGKPDIILPRFSTVIFVNGCFWHHHEGCKDGRFPQTNRKFWKDKLLANVARDKEAVRALENMGWHVLTLWECQIKDINYLERRLFEELYSERSWCEAD
ncbi:very short patch repair endonuclease [uncultured Pseudodesulfovibrio sp.]|uniref:very short patch repair endonuclease n=1 Tax=uncultured Pseudodesulfovibrio sp. TaxID=2035858 RepID=UPI0029C7C375|nr:very short patch repair endonuclease [uncultured Pseudodesulfovibrio sp.]